MNATTLRRHYHISGTALQALWAESTWRAILHLVSGVLLGLTAILEIAFLLLLHWFDALTIPAIILSLLIVGVLLMLIHPALSSWQRSRFSSVLGVEIPPRPSEPEEDSFLWFWNVVRQPDSWKQVGYHVFAGAFAPFAAVLVIVWISLGIALVPMPLYTLGWDRFVPQALWYSAAGLTLLLLAPWLARGLAAWDLAAARQLLGISPQEELTRRVASLAASREGAVDAADAERRRIERDLHDGAQQRLTSLALNLGIARVTLTELPEPARRVIEEAHEEAKQALAELRDLVRGLHPAVLQERGLDAALSGIAARSPVPVRLNVSLPERIDATVEAVAYFVVAEAINNAVRHAGASRIDVSVRRMQDSLKITVKDDGRGGADPQQGTGLRGLSQRVASVDGILHVHSPVGGPTSICVELPCVS